MLHATWNLGAKRGGGSISFALYTALVIGLFWAPVNLIFLLELPDRSPLSWGPFAWAVVAASTVVHAAYFVVLLHGYRHAPLSVVYPVTRGSAPLLSCLGGVLVFGERLSLPACLGILGIVSGVIMIAWRRNAGHLEAAGIKHGLIWGAVTGSFVAAYTVIDAYAIKSLNIHPLPFDYVVNTARVLVLVPFVADFREALLPSPEARRAALVVGLLGPAGYVMILFALQLAPLSYVAPAREISLMFGVLLGGTLLKEGELTRRLVAAALIAGGVAALVSA